MRLRLLLSLPPSPLLRLSLVQSQAVQSSNFPNHVKSYSAVIILCAERRSFEHDGRGADSEYRFIQRLLDIGVSDHEFKVIVHIF